MLLVEAPADQFGFELRSLQEFFAAGQLTDGARDTTQRYERFEAICLLAHWRNVALFFAGRVGRVFPGEAANIVEVCRDVDRDGIDVWLKQGARLALELASDRAFGPNRRLQRSLIELAMQLLQEPLESLDERELVTALANLSPEDVRDLVQPLLRAALAASPVEAVPALLDLSLTTGLPWNDLSSHAQRLIHGGADPDILRGLRVAVRQRVAQSTLVWWFSQLGARCSNIAQRKERLTWYECETLARALSSSGRIDALETLLEEQLDKGSFLGVDEEAYDEAEDPEQVFDRLRLVLLCSRALAEVDQNRHGQDSLIPVLAQRLATGELPPELLVGQVDELWQRLPGELDQRFRLVAWVIHLLAGEPTGRTVQAARTCYLAAAQDSTWAYRLVQHFGIGTSPGILLLACQDVPVDSLAPYCGGRGTERAQRFA